jgi:hypothetical protein
MWLRLDTEPALGKPSAALQERCACSKSDEDVCHPKTAERWRNERDDERSEQHGPAETLEAIQHYGMPGPGRGRLRI